MSDPHDGGSEPPDGPSADRGIDRSVAEAKRYLERADAPPEGVRQERARVVELLTAPRSTRPSELDKRVTASGALARLARVDPASLQEFLPALVEELRRETDSAVSCAAREHRVQSRTIRANLVETVSRTIIDASEETVGKDAFGDFVRAVATDLDERTLRVAAQALFDSAGERPTELASAAGLLDELLAYPDRVVRAWAAGTVGRVAASHPDAVATTGASLRRLLTHDDSAVQHNTVEALAAFVGTRPDVVAPAADTLQDLLDHDEVAIQHNAVGVLYVLAEHRPEAVIPAVEVLQDLRDHHDETIKRIATGTLARLAQEELDGAADSNPGKS